jgi:hypothetical protein
MDTADALDSMYSNELIKNDEKFVQLLIETNDKAASGINKGNCKESLQILEKMEKLLEHAASCGRNLDRNLVIVILYNVACAYQSMWVLDKCSKYIDGVIYNLNESLKQDEVSYLQAVQKKMSWSHLQALRTVKLRKQHFLLKIYLQHCAVLSQLSKHDQALNIVKKSNKAMHTIIQDCIEYCREMKKRVDSPLPASSTPTPMMTSSKASFLSGKDEMKAVNVSTDGKKTPIFKDEVPYLKILLEYAVPFLNELWDNLREFSASKNSQAFMEAKRSLFNWKNNPENNEKYLRKEFRKAGSQADLFGENRSLLGVQHTAEWLENLNIGTIMHMKPLKYQEYAVKRELITEITKESLQEKVIFQSLILFTTATEMRFIEMADLKESKKSAKEDLMMNEGYRQSESYHLKAIELVCKYINGPCPFINHLITSYQKHYNQNLETIPEESFCSTNADRSIRKPSNANSKAADAISRLEEVGKMIFNDDLLDDINEKPEKLEKPQKLEKPKEFFPERKEERSLEPKDKKYIPERFDMKRFQEFKESKELKLAKEKEAARSFQSDSKDSIKMKDERDKRFSEVYIKSDERSLSQEPGPFHSQSVSAVIQSSAPTNTPSYGTKTLKTNLEELKKIYESGLTSPQAALLQNFSSKSAGNQPLRDRPNPISNYQKNTEADRPDLSSEKYFIKKTFNIPVLNINKTNNYQSVQEHHLHNKSGNAVTNLSDKNSHSFTGGFKSERMHLRNERDEQQPPNTPHQYSSNHYSSNQSKDQNTVPSQIRDQNTMPTATDMEPKKDGKDPGINFFFYKNFNKFIQNLYIQDEQMIKKKINENKKDEKLLPYKKDPTPLKSSKTPTQPQQVPPKRPSTNNSKGNASTEKVYKDPRLDFHRRPNATQIDIKKYQGQPPTQLKQQNTTAHPSGFQLVTSPNEAKDELIKLYMRDVQLKKSMSNKITKSSSFKNISNINIETSRPRIETKEDVIKFYSPREKLN